MGNYIHTFTGLSYTYGEQNEFAIEDIAHSLSLQCRYNGHVSEFYSVAEHCVLLARYALENLDADLAWECLMHDSTETYVCDVPRPMKPLMPDYGKLEDDAGMQLAKAFKFTYPIPDVVKELDYAICVDEMNQLMPHGFAPGVPGLTGPPGLGITIQCWDAKRAKREFTTMFNTLAIGRGHG